MTYEANIDMGEGGVTTFEADDVDAAMAMAVEWAEGGEWRQDGSVIVRVEGPDGERREDVAVKATGYC